MADREGNRQTRTLVWLGLLLIALTVWLAAIGRPLVTSAAPYGIVSFELAADSARARQIMASWTPAGREAAMLSLGVDFLYLVVYPLWLTFALWLAGDVAGGAWRRGSRVLARIVPLAAPLDAIENLALIRQLVEGAAELPACIALLAAVPKFLLVAVAVIFLLAVLPVLAARRFIRR